MFREVQQGLHEVRLGGGRGRARLQAHACLMQAPPEASGTVLTYHCGHQGCMLSWVS